eukprot:gene35468-33622_t
MVQELVDAAPGAPRSVADAVAALPEGRGAATPAAQELLRAVGSALAHMHARGQPLLAQVAAEAVQAVTDERRDG